MAKTRMAVKKEISSRDSKSALSMPTMEGFSWKFFVGFLLLVIITLLSFYGVKIWQQLWPVKNIVLEGEYRYLQKQDLMNLLKKQENKGLLAIDLEQLQLDVQKSDWVKNVEIRKVWPDQLIFNLTEHEPVIFVGNGVLTREGSLIKTEIKDEYIERLPEFYFSSNQALTSDYYFNILDEFRKIKRVLISLNLSIKLLTIDDFDNWFIDLKNDLKINLGRKNRLQRVERLVKVYPVIKNKTEIKKIDLRYHNGLAIKWENKQEKQLKG